jgi:hypothetical protein
MDVVSVSEVVAVDCHGNNPAVNVYGALNSDKSNGGFFREAPSASESADNTNTVVVLTLEDEIGLDMIICL